MAFIADATKGLQSWGQGLFTVDPNATPEQLARKRQALAALMPDGRARYVGEGLADLAKGIVGGIKSRRMDQFEGEKRKTASDAFSAMLNRSPAPQGPMTVLGMNPEWGQEQLAEPQQGGFSIVPNAAPGAAQTWGRDALVQGLVQRGLPQHVAEGFAMNAQDESGMNPGINEAAPIVPGSRGGFGLMQWTGPRRRQLEAFAQQRGGNVADPNIQMDFLMSELGGSEAAAAQAIMGAGTAGEAGAAIVNRFLRPAEEHRARREAEYLGGAPSQAGPSVGFAPIPQYSGPPLADLQAAVSNPWLSQEERQMAASMLERAYQQSDPMYQMQMQQAQMGLRKSAYELAQMGQPEQVKPIEINGQLVNPQTGEVMGDYRTPETPTPTDDMREYEFAQAQGYQGTFQDFMNEGRRAGATQVNLGGGDNKQVFDAMAESAVAARSAVTGLNAVSEARKALDGGIISGAGADTRLGLQKLGAFLGVADPTIIQNTETFRAAIAPQVAAMMKATVGSTQISNADREFAEKAAGGSIALDAGSIRRLVDIMERGSKAVVQSHIDRLNQVYPEGGGFDRERALFGVQAPVQATPPQRRRYNPQTGGFE